MGFNGYTSDFDDANEKVEYLLFCATAEPDRVLSASCPP